MADKPLTKTQTAQLAVLQANGPILFWKRKDKQARHLKNPEKFPKRKLTVNVLDTLVKLGLVQRKDGDIITVISNENKYLGTVEETYDALIEFRVVRKGRK